MFFFKTVAPLSVIAFQDEGSEYRVDGFVVGGEDQQTFIFFRFLYTDTEAFFCNRRPVLFGLQDEDNEYRLDGFVVGDDDESQNERRRRSKGGSGDNKRKRLRKAREEDVMEAADDEDLELIREAQGVRCVPRGGWGQSAVVMSRGFRLAVLSGVFLLLLRVCEFFVGCDLAFFFFF